MANKWADVAHYYLKSSLDVVIEEDGVTLIAYDSIFAPSGRVIAKQHRGEGRVDHPINAEIGQYKPILRHLEDMTESEALGLIKIFLESSDVDPFDDSEISFRIHRNDNGLMLDKDCAVMFVIEARCWDGDLVIYQDGTIESCDSDTGERYRVTNLMQMVHYLIFKGFNVFGLEWGAECIRKGVDNG